MNRTPYSPEAVIFVFAASTLALMLIVKLLGYYEKKGRKRKS